jgi:hypothetical protein
VKIDIFKTREIAKGSPSPAAASGGAPYWLLIAAIGVLLYFQFRDKIPDIIPEPGPAPIPIVTEREAVLLAITNTMPAEQGQVAMSQKVKEFCRGQGIDLRVYDVRDDLTKEDKQWQDMMAAAKSGPPPAMVTVDKNKRGRVRNIPATIDETLKLIGELKK